MPRHKDNISRIEFIAEGLKDLGNENLIPLVFVRVGGGAAPGTDFLV